MLRGFENVPQVTTAVVASDFSSATKDDVGVPFANEGFRIGIPPSILELGQARVQGVVAGPALEVASLREVTAVFPATIGLSPVASQNVVLVPVKLFFPFSFRQLVWVVM